MYIEKNEKLLKNYEIHIGDFIKNMIKNPIKINIYKIKHMTTREEFFAKSSDKILDKKGFSFKSFKTDKEKLKTYIQKQESNYHNNFNEKNMKKNLKKKFMEIKDCNNKNKDDIKKIFDTFRHNDDLTNEERIFYEKVKYYDNEEDENYDNIFYDKKNILKIINDNSLTDEDKYKKLLHNKIYNERKNASFLRKLKLKHLNKVKKLNKTNSDFFSKKTNFKAMENITLFKSPIIKHKINKTFSTNELKIDNNKDKNIYNKTASKFHKFHKIKFNKNLKKNKLKQYSLDYNDKKFSLLFSSKNPLDDISLRKEIVQINPLLFQYNINYMKYLKNINENDYSLFNDKIISLKKMAFEKKENNDNIIKYDNKLYEILKQNEDILIDGERFNKTDIDKIADKLLKKCNWKPEVNKKSFK